MITKNTLVQITIEVPIGDIEIVNAKVIYEKESRDCPESTDVSYDCILVEGIPENYEIVDYEDNLIDELAELRWSAGE